MIADILKTKLEAIDTECESEVRPEVNKLYAEAHYDGSKFCVPSFQGAGALWLNLIKKKEREFIREIARVLVTPGVTVNKADAVAVRRMIEDAFADDHYLERMRIFHEGIARKAVSYGLVYNAHAYGIDTYESAYRADIMNALRIARNNVIAELELHGQSSTPEFVRSLFRGWHYFLAHPLRFLAAGVLIILALFFSQVSFSDILQWLRNCYEWLQSLVDTKNN